ncbi:M23 family metallopeptidase [Mongoliibacter sp.]|uniref:M23 family metallopeptidase n=1 Tax=Mongoliibacter sp. TaxID=2022438 RepID=UPI0025E17959|nr:M23 family metallopeptidase [Mongoliibacter sp.]
MNIKSIGLFGFLGLILLGCNGTNFQKILGPSNPYEQYSNFLNSSEFENAAIVRDWVNAGERAFDSPVEITLPYQEISHFEKNQPKAIYMEFEAKEGQIISAEVKQISTKDARFFLDLYEVSNSGRKNIQFAKDTSQLNFQVKNTGKYGVRIQPELFRGGVVELLVQQNPSLAFPIGGKNHRSIASFFGDPRDGGRRRHEGVDVFAPRGTPVIAVSSGRVNRVGNNNLGGKIINMSGGGYSYYYAHLDTQMVKTGQAVNIGDTLGTVGNTGNAISTPPHLHFGIYRSGRGAVDPFPFFEERRLSVVTTIGDSINLGKVVRVKVPTANLRSKPGTNAEIIQKLPNNTVATIQGKTNDWYRVLLPDGRVGYLFENLLAYELSAFGSLEEKEEFMIRENFADNNNFEASRLGENLEVIGEFQDSRLLITESGKYYWAF